MAKTEDGYIQLGSENTSYVSVGKDVKDQLEEKAKELKVRKGIIYRALGAFVGTRLTREAWEEMMKEAGDSFSPLELFFTNGIDAQLKVHWVKARIMSFVEAGDVTSKAFKAATDILNRISEGKPVKASEFDAYQPPEAEVPEEVEETEEEPAEEDQPEEDQPEEDQPEEDQPEEDQPEEEPKEAEAAPEKPTAAVPDHRTMAFTDIKTLAKDQGLEVKGRRKRDFIKALTAHYGQ